MNWEYDCVLWDWKIVCLVLFNIVFKFCEIYCNFYYLRFSLISLCEPQTYFLQHQQRVTTLGVKLHRIYISPTKREHDKEVKNWCNLQHLGSLISKFQYRQKNNAHVQSCGFRNLDTTFWGCFLATKSFGVSSYTQIQVDYHKKSPKKIHSRMNKGMLQGRADLSELNPKTLCPRFEERMTI